MTKGPALWGALLVALAAGIAIGITISPLLTSEPAAATVPNEPVMQSNQVTVHIVAVSLDGTGVMGTATIEVVPGRGRTLINAEPFIEPDTQESVAVAKPVAERYANISLSDSDLIVSFELPFDNDTTQLIGGPSAGAAVTVAIIAAIKNQTVLPNVAITGRILPDGKIGSVNGIIEKAKAAGEAGLKTFMIPYGQSDVAYYEKVEERSSTDGYYVTRISYVPKQLSIDNYTQQWNMTTVEVRNIEELAKYAIASR